MLALIRGLVFVFVPVMIWAGQSAAQDVTAQEAQMFALVNGHRASAGCAPLALNPQLQAAAEGHARAMADKNFFGHQGKGGAKLKGRAKAAGYKGGYLGENIANGQKTAEAVVSAWMGSEGHRSNILRCAFKETGVALVYDPDDQPLPGGTYAPRYYWVQVFGKR